MKVGPYIYITSTLFYSIKKSIKYSEKQVTCKKIESIKMTEHAVSKLH